MLPCSSEEWWLQPFSRAFWLNSHAVCDSVTRTLATMLCRSTRLIVSVWGVAHTTWYGPDFFGRTFTDGSSPADVSPWQSFSAGELLTYTTLFPLNRRVFPIFQSTMRLEVWRALLGIFSISCIRWCWKSCTCIFGCSGGEMLYSSFVSLVSNRLRIFIGMQLNSKMNGVVPDFLCICVF